MSSTNDQKAGLVRLLKRVDFQLLLSFLAILLLVLLSVKLPIDRCGTTDRIDTELLRFAG